MEFFVFFQCKFNYLFYGRFFQIFKISQNSGKKSRVFFFGAKFHQNAENKYERGILYHNILVSLKKIAKFQLKNGFILFFQIWTPVLVW